MKVNFYRYGKHDDIVCCSLKKIKITKKIESENFITTMSIDVNVMKSHVLSTFNDGVNVGANGLSNHIILLMYQKSKEIMK